MEIHRTERRPTDSGDGDDDWHRPSAGTTSRADDFIRHGESAALPPQLFAKTSGDVCDFEKPDVEMTCPREGLYGATPFIKGLGDVSAVDPNDVKQRRIGDCYLFAAVIALTQSPAGRKHIENMIAEVAKPDGSKAYRVTFGDKTVEVTANDFIKGHAAVGDTYGPQKEVWPLVIEAAYAKLKSGYHNIHGGKPADAFAALTGKAAAAVILGGPRSDISGIVDGARTGAPMTVSFPGPEDANANGPADAAHHMYANHAYAITGVVIKDHELCVILKNPWGDDDPTPVPVHELEKRHARLTIGPKP